MNKRHFELAKKLSHKSTYKYKLGAVLTKKNKVIGLGFNSIKTHTKSNHPFKMIHAEFDAILNSQLEDFSNCSIYVYRETKAGKPAMSYPCAHCLQMIRSLGIETIYFTDNEGFKKEAV